MSQSAAESSASMALSRCRPGARRHLRRPPPLVRGRRQAERPSTRRTASRCARSRSPPTPARPSTAGTCSSSPRTASRRSTRQTGHVIATIPAPGGGGDSGLTWAEGTLWVGQYRDRKIHQLDPETGACCARSSRTASSPASPGSTASSGTPPGKATRATCGGSTRDTGEVLESLELPPGVGVSGLESDGGDRFFCGGGRAARCGPSAGPRRRISRREVSGGSRSSQRGTAVGIAPRRYSTPRRNWRGVLLRAGGDRSAAHRVEDAGAVALVRLLEAYAEKAEPRQVPDAERRSGQRAVDVDRPHAR